MQDMHLVLHGLALKKHADAASIAGITGLPQARVETLLKDAQARGRVSEAQGRYLLAPTARMALEGEYSKHYDGLRRNADFLAAYEAFEIINLELKQLITDWQTLEVGGARVANDHGNAAYDARVIDRLGNLHEHADRILARLAQALPRLQIWRDKLVAALERAEDGEHEWVSEVRIDSYHTLWFELHEDLLRIVGRTRVE